MVTSVVGCPTCRHAQDRQPTINFAVVDLLERIATHEQHVAVERCAAPTCNQPAVWFCTDDNAAVCDAHRHSAHVPPFPNPLSHAAPHHIVPIAQRPAASIPHTCPEHHAQMTLWCNSCRSLCCATCASHGAHRLHQTQNVQAVAFSIRRSPQYSSADSALSAAAAKVSREAQRLAFIQAAIQCSGQRGAQAIEATRARLLAELNAHIGMLSQRVEDEQRSALHVVSVRINAITAARAAIDRDIQQLHSVLRLSDYELAQRGEAVPPEQSVARADALLVAVPVLPIGIVVQGLNNVGTDVTLPGTTVLTTAEPVATWWTGHGEEEGKFSGAYGVTVDEDRVYLCDGACVQVFDKRSGHYLSQFGGSGNASGQFDEPTGIAVHAGRIYVCDLWNFRVQVFSAHDCAFLLQFDTSGPAAGTHPIGIAASDAAVFVSDISNDRVCVFDLDGRFLRQITGDGAEQLKGPRGVALHATLLYVADSDNDRVQVFDAASGQFVRTVGGGGQLHRPRAVAVAAASGHLFVGNNCRVTVFDANGDIVQHLGDVPNRHIGVNGIAMSGGRVWVAGPDLGVFDFPVQP